MFASFSKTYNIATLLQCTLKSQYNNCCSYYTINVFPSFALKRYKNMPTTLYVIINVLNNCNTIVVHITLMMSLFRSQRTFVLTCPVLPTALRLDHSNNTIVLPLILTYSAFASFSKTFFLT